MEPVNLEKLATHVSSGLNDLYLKTSITSTVIEPLQKLEEYVKDNTIYSPLAKAKES
jgi:hypothetical protein